MSITRIESGSAYEPKIGYCRAVVADGWVLVSGTVGNDHATMTTPENVVAQCELALGHISAALAGAGASFADVVRVNYILPDRRDFEPCWPLLRAAFGDNPPAATMIEAGLIDPAMKIEIEVTARLP
ncbi:MAG: RidA family protein [Marinosulfonomonas sp.]|nr:RidA family protein [Marinosulfonomonas sp.]